MRWMVGLIAGAVALGGARLAHAQSEGEPSEEEAVVIAPEASQAGDAVVVPEVEVEADREADEPSKARRTDEITEDDINRRSSWRLGDALRWLTSATPVESTGTSSGLIVDGLPPAQLQVTEDGLPVSRPVGGPNGPSVNLDSISLLGRDVERVEVHRGMGPPGSGPAGGVIVAMHRKDLERGFGLALHSAARARAVSPTVSSPMLALGAGRISYGTEPLDLQLHGNLNRTRGIDVNNDRQIDSPDQREFRLGARSVWRPTDDASDSLVLDVSYDDVLTEGTYGPTSVLRDLVDTRQIIGRLTGEWRSSDGSSVEHKSQLDAYDHRFSKRVLDSGFERLKADTGQLRFVQDVLAQKAVGLHLLGVELYGSAERISRTGETGELPTVDRLHGGLGLSDLWAPTSSVEVSGRLWGDIHTDFAPGWMADLGVGWQVGERVQLRASGSRTRR